MSKPKPVFNKFYLLLFTFVTLIAIITNGCRKNNNSKEAPADVHGLQIDLDALKADYASDTLLIKQKIAGTNTSTAADLIKNTGIKWDAIYYRERNDSRILEFDVQKGNKNIIPGFLGGVSHSNFHDKTSLVFLQFNNGTNMRFFMEVVETGEDATGQIIQGLHYSFIPDSFTGYIFYYTTGKQIMGGYTYTNGKITGTYTSATTGGTKTQAVNTIKNHTMAGTCTAWYWGNDEVGWEFLGITCDVRDGDGGDGRAPGDSGGGGATTDPCAVPPPGPPKPPKPPTGPPTVLENIKVVGGHPKIMAISGCPPTGTTTVTVPDMDIIDSLSNRYPCAKALIAALPNLNSDLARIIFEAFDSKNGNNIIFLEGDAAYFATHTLEDGVTNFDRNNGILTNSIYINPAVLANSSNEYRIATLYHEAIHAFLNSEYITLGATAFATKYPMVNVFEKQNFSQVAGKDKYDYYLDPAYQTKVVGKDHLTMAEYFMNGLKDAILAYNPNFPPERALALAKAGIVVDNSTIFVNYNSAERDVTRGTSVGTRCTP